MSLAAATELADVTGNLGTIGYGLAADRPRYRCRHRLGVLHHLDRPPARVRRSDPDLRLPRLRGVRGAGAARLRGAVHPLITGPR